MMMFVCLYSLFQQRGIHKNRQFNLLLILLYRVHLKQNKYPVLFLSSGPTKRYVPYKDWRCTAFQRGISFAKAEGLLVGTSLFIKKIISLSFNVFICMQLQEFHVAVLRLF